MTQGITAYYRDGYEQRKHIVSLKEPDWWPLRESQADAVLLSGEVRRVDKKTVELQIGNITAPLHDCFQTGITMDMLK